MGDLGQSGPVIHLVRDGQRVYNRRMHPQISIVQNHGRIGVHLDSETVTIETIWTATRSTSAPTALGDALRALGQRVDELPHGDYKKLVAALPAGEIAKTRTA